MFDESELRGLLAYSPSHPVLSVYLNTDPSEGNIDDYRLRLRYMLKTIDLPEDVSAVERFISREYFVTGRSVVMFSCAPEGYFRTYSLAIPVHDLIRVGDKPVVKPLASLLDFYGGYGVVLVDKQGARAFNFHLGELVEQEGFLGETIRHTKHGGASTFPGRRGGTAGQTHYEDEVVDRNMKDMADFAARFFTHAHVRRILIGGTDDNVAMFRSLLPKTWQSLVIGEFQLPMTASQREVLSKTMQIGQEAERKREAGLVEDLITAAAKGEQAVVGLEQTIEMVNLARIQTLIIHANLASPGYRCTGCGRLSVEPEIPCSVCEGEIETVEDMVEIAVQKVLGAGGDVEVVSDNSTLHHAGDVGGLLRY